MNILRISYLCFFFNLTNYYFHFSSLLIILQIVKLFSFPLQSLCPKILIAYLFPIYFSRIILNYQLILVICPQY